MYIIISIFLIIFVGYILANLKYILKDCYFYQILNVVLNLITVSIVLLNVYPIVFTYSRESFIVKCLISVLIILIYKIIDITCSSFYKRITASANHETNFAMTMLISITVFILIVLYIMVGWLL